MGHRPGLAKTRGVPLVVVRDTRLARATDGRWRALFDEADAVSEGLARSEATGRVWYGSTSLLLRLPPEVGEDERVFVRHVAERDVHVRLRAVRMARREAVLRAPSPLGVSTCEMSFRLDPGGLRIDVDVEAPLIEAREHGGGHERR